MSIDFRAIKIRQSNVVLAWDRVAAHLGLSESQKRKIRKPKIEAFAVVDEDFERIRIQRHEYVAKGPKAKQAEATRILEYGVNYSVSDNFKAINAFTTVFWHGSSDKIAFAEIFIRASIYKDNRTGFYEILEHEVRHVMFPDLIIVYG